jgi:hypothetical protein
MTPNCLEYPLNDGFVENWLVYGPLTTPVEGMDCNIQPPPEQIQGVANRFFDPTLGVEEEVKERGIALVAGNEKAWKYYRCQEDHRVDISDTTSRWTHSCVIAACDLHVPGAAETELRLITANAVDVWLNDQLVYHSDTLSETEQTHLFAVNLQPENRLFVRVRQVAVDRWITAFSLQFTSLNENDQESVQVCLPTIAKYPSRFQELETNLDKAALEQTVNYRGNGIKLRWTEGTGDDFHFQYQVQDQQERIYVEGTWQPEADGTDIGHPFRLFERSFRVVLRAPAREYYETNNRYQREMPLQVLDTKYADQPSGTYAVRRAEALKDAAKHERTLFGQIARIIAGRTDVDEQVFHTAAESVDRRELGWEVEQLGLLGIAGRVNEAEGLAGIAAIILESAERFAAKPASSATSEAGQISLAGCKVLAGQLTGNEGLRSEGEAEGADWIRLKGKNGFQDWLSPSQIESVIAALATITSSAEDVNLQELAAVLLDKLLFELAAHTFNGAYSSAHGKTEAGMLKSAQMEATAGLARMLFGMGVYNPTIAGVVSLAAADYEFPTFLGEIANERFSESLIRENQAGTSIVTHRSPDGMLSSVQDWRAGQKGASEQVWQAALGPDAIVFVSHPACSSESPAHRPGFWLGNAVLPRVAQRNDTLVAVYNFSAEGMDFTHAHFPVYQFDEYVLRDGWAFARKGEGYLAITAARGLEMIKQGRSAYRELRSHGSPNIWICQMGRAAKDGSFAEFQAKMLGVRLEWPENAVKFTTIRGESLEFGWNTPLRVNGSELKLGIELAIESPYCTAELGSSQYEIGFGDTAVRLTFD